MTPEHKRLAVLILRLNEILEMRTEPNKRLAAVQRNGRMFGQDRRSRQSKRTEDKHQGDVTSSSSDAEPTVCFREVRVHGETGGGLSVSQRLPGRPGLQSLQLHPVHSSQHRPALHARTVSDTDEISLFKICCTEACSRYEFKFICAKL